jgi:CheY-like chemotaxis protein
MVSDTGVGLSPEQLGNLFRRFSQADETTTRKYGGTGLGLALTRGLAIILGGTIDVESKEGAGSTFTVILPTHYRSRTVDVSAIGEVDGEKANAKPVNPDAPLVMIIDDEPSAREVLERLLTKEGFAVTAASSGKQALDMLETIRPIAILLDVMMPGLDGWHVLRKIRGNEKTANIPVIIQTVLDDQNFAFALGASGFIKKPIRRKQLSELLNEVSRPETGSSALIVGGDAKSASQLATMLRDDGWDTLQVEDGAQALSAISKSPPSLIIVDLKPNEPAGYDFISEFYKSPQGTAIPIVAMTSNGKRASRIQTINSGTRLAPSSMPFSDLVVQLRRFSEPPPAPGKSFEMEGSPRG